MTCHLLKPSNILLSQLHVAKARRETIRGMREGEGGEEILHLIGFFPFLQRNCVADGDLFARNDASQTCSPFLLSLQSGSLHGKL